MVWSSCSASSSMAACTHSHSYHTEQETSGKGSHVVCVAKGRVVLDYSLPQTLRLTSSP